MFANRVLWGLCAVLLTGVASAAEVRGILVKIDPEKKEFTLEGRGRGLRGTALTFQADQDTQVLFGPDAGTLADLSPGKRVRVVYEVRDGKQVVQVVHVPGSKPRAAPLPGNAVTGKLARVAVTDREIVVLGPRGGGEVETTFALPEGAKIVRGDKAVTLDDLKEGERVAVQVEKKEGKEVAVAVQVLGPEEDRLTKVRNVLKQVDFYLGLLEQMRKMKP